jgi:hypothetical protein
MRIVALFVLGLTALARPPQQFDFSGTWVATKEAPKGIDPAPSALMGQRFALAVAGGNVTLTRPGRDGSLVTVMALGGPEVRWRPPAAGCTADFMRVEKMALEDSALVFTLVGIVPPGGGGPRTSNIRYVMRSEGPDTIAVQSTVVQQGQPKPVATVYKRSTEAMPAPAPASALPVKGVPARITDAGWIGTLWSGTSASNVTTEERWTAPASGVMLGVSRTLRGAEMPSYEFLCITEREGSLVYFAMPNARTPATPFVLTAITPDSATFENPSHDFPKLIRYTRLADGSLQTTISGGPGTRETNVMLKKQ